MNSRTLWGNFALPNALFLFLFSFCPPPLLLRSFMITFIYCMTRNDIHVDIHVWVLRIGIENVQRFWKKSSKNWEKVRGTKEEKKGGKSFGEGVGEMFSCVCRFIREILIRIILMKKICSKSKS